MRRPPRVATLGAAALALLAQAAAAAPRQLDAIPPVLVDLRPTPTGLEATGGDPSLTWRFWPAETARVKLSVDMRVDAEAPLLVGQVFVAAPGAPFVERDSVKFLVAADGRFRRHEILLPPVRFSRVRLDPLSGPGQISVRAISLLPAAPTAGAILEFGRDELAATWTPGPGLAETGPGAFRTTGASGAFLVSPASLELDGGVALRVETRIQLDGVARFVAVRACQGSSPTREDAACQPAEAVPTGAARSLYVDVPPRAGRVVRMVSLELVDPVPGGLELVVHMLRIVPLQPAPVDSLFVRHAEAVSRRAPARTLAVTLLGVAALLAVAATARRLGGRGAGAVDSLVDAASLAATVAVPVMLASFPFEIYTPQRSRFLHAEIDVPSVTLMFAFAMGLLRRATGRAPLAGLRRVEAAAALYVGACGLAALLSPAVTESLGMVERHTATFALAILAGLYAPPAGAQGRAAASALLAALAFTSGLGVVQALGGKGALYGGLFRGFFAYQYDVNVRPRAFGVTGHPIALGTCLLALLPAALLIARRGGPWIRRAAYAAATLAVGCLVLTLSRSAYLALLLALPFGARVVPQRQRRRLAVVMLLVVSVAALVLVLRTPRGSVEELLPAGLAPAGARLDVPEDLVAVRQRLRGARIAWVLFLEHPLAGAGPGQLRRLYVQELRPGDVQRAPVWSTAESSYLLLLAECGPLGLLAFVLLLAAVGAVGWQAVRRGGAAADAGWALLATLVGYAAHMAFWDGISWLTPSLTAGVVLGLLGSATRHGVAGEVEHTDARR